MAYRKPTAPIPTKKLLESLYNRPMSLRQVAKEAHSPLTSIYRLMQQYNIPIRSVEEGLSISLNTPEVNQKLRRAKMRQGFPAQRIKRITTMVRVAMRPLRLLDAQNTSCCVDCLIHPAKHAHHTPALSDLAVALLIEGLEDLQVVVQLTMAHYARTIQPVPLCVACHRLRHSKP